MRKTGLVSSPKVTLGREELWSARHYTRPRGPVSIFDNKKDRYEACLFYYAEDGTCLPAGRAVARNKNPPVKRVVFLMRA